MSLQNPELNFSGTYMNDLTGSKGNFPKLKDPRFLCWVLVGMGIFSCLARADYNVVGGLAILLVLSNSAKFNDKVKSKLSLQLDIVFTVVDLLWILGAMFSWTHKESDSDLWKSLSCIHNLVYFVGLCEFAIKIYIGFLLFKMFKSYYNNVKDLVSLKYD